MQRGAEMASDLALSSIALSIVALALFFLPILGIPLGAIGLILGVLGLGISIRRGRAALNYSLAGIGLASLALVIGCSIAFAPEGYVQRRNVPRMWQQVPGVPYVAPPARAGD